MFRLIPVLTQKYKSRLDIYFHFINKHHLLPSPKLIFMHQYRQFLLQLCHFADTALT